jgi:ABC-2 type transport system permease protein
MRIIALIKRICQQMFRDKRTLALLFVAPLLILTLMFFLFNGNTVDPKLAVANIDNSIVKVLKDSKIKVIQYDKVTEKTVVADNLDGLLQMDNGKYKLTLKNNDPGAAKALQMKVNQAIATIAQAKLMKQIAAPVSIPNKSVETQFI